MARYPVRLLCTVLSCHPSGYYAWLKTPVTQREKKEREHLGLIKQSWFESGGVYGYRKIYRDLLAQGVACGKNRVARLMKLEGLYSQRGYHRRYRYHSGQASEVADNHLQRQFEVRAPNQVWVTDITYIKTHEGWLFLAVVMDLFSRHIIGWSMSRKINSDLVLNALIMALWRRKPKHQVLVHSDQGSQYTSYDWSELLQAHGLKASMSRKGNCHDNAVAESFFAQLKRERIKRRIYSDREQAKQDIFDYIEMFYNAKRRHGNNDDVSPVEFEKNYFMKLRSL